MVSIQCFNDLGVHVPCACKICKRCFAIAENVAEISQLLHRCRNKTERQLFDLIHSLFQSAVLFFGMKNPVMLACSNSSSFTFLSIPPA